MKPLTSLKEFIESIGIHKTNYVDIIIVNIVGIMLF